jgi:oxygen-dependent protoporphyrinogen oxidase
MIPTRLGPIATTRLISPLGKLRMGLDLVLPPRPASGDETLGSFIERRLGREAYRWLVDPLVGGIYAGDGHRLSLVATFPQLAALERDYGGLIRGTLAMKRQAAAPTGGSKPSPFQTPRGGLGELVAALAECLHAMEVRIETGTTATAITRSIAGDYQIELASGETIHADAIVCAAPAPAAGEFLAGFDADLAAQLRAIPYASVATVALAYARMDIPHPLDGSGYLVPRAERRLVKACTWVSCKWAHRAPAGAELIRVSLGGAGQEAVLEASDDDLTGIAREEMRSLLGIEAAPLLTRLFRWPEAMPQYELGHQERIATIEARLNNHPGLALAGNAYRGVGLADCAQSGEQAAARVGAFLARSAVPAHAAFSGKE